MIYSTSRHAEALRDLIALLDQRHLRRNDPDFEAELVAALETGRALLDPSPCGLVDMDCAGCYGNGVCGFEPRA